MQVRSKNRRAAAVFLSAVLLTAIAGCGGQRVEAGGEPDVPGALTESAEALPETESPAPVLPAPETGSPTLPPGDPGNNSAAPPPEEDHDLPPRTDVPDAAVLDAETVGAVAGGRWTAVPAPPDSCAAPRPADALVARTVALKASSGLVSQTVSIFATGEAAEAAVPLLATRLTSCGWSREASPPLGEAAAQLRRVVGADVQRVAVVAVEGVAVTVVGSGAVAAQDKLASVVDVAVNSSCAAAADGCH